MIITPDFVYLHLPKTGGTFVATTLMEIHRDRGDLVDTVYSSEDTQGRPNPYFKSLRSRSDGYCIRLMVPNRYQHGVCSDIPLEYRDLPVVASVRNPFDRYVSQFKFGWWKKDFSLFGGLEAVRNDYPTYPDLGFTEFVGFANDRLLPYREACADGAVAGLQTQQVIVQYCRKPRSVLRKLDLEYIRSGAHLDDLCPQRFFHQDQLSEELAAFLKDGSYRGDEVETVRTAGRVDPPEGARPAHDDWNSYYTPDLKSRVRDLDRFLFAMFPEYDS
jgi:hypothetical protein